MVLLSAEATWLRLKAMVVVVVVGGGALEFIWELPQLCRQMLLKITCHCASTFGPHAALSSLPSSLHLWLVPPWSLLQLLPSSPTFSFSPRLWVSMTKSASFPSKHTLLTLNWGN